MLNKCPSKCEECKSSDWEDLPSAWKCKKCGKNHGKTLTRIISKTMPASQKWFSKGDADVIENVRPDGKTSKVIDRKRKKSYTKVLKDDWTTEVIQERDL